MNKILEIKRKFEEALEAKTGYGRNEIKIIYNDVVINVMAKDEDIFNEFPFTRADDLWKCENSPTSYCIYNINLDPELDSCIICGEPFERK